MSNSTDIEVHLNPLHGLAAAIVRLTELPLKDGRTLRTLHDARDMFASGAFSGVPHSPPLEHAIELLIRAAETGEPGDVTAATNQIAVALRWHGIADCAEAGNRVLHHPQRVLHVEQD